MWPFDIPTPIHKYGDENLIHSLTDENLMFSKPSDLNDPFEFLPSLKWLCHRNENGIQFCLGEDQFFESKDENFPGEIVTFSAQDWREKIERDWFVTSLTTKPKDPRMWAQYAKNHTGLCLTLNLNHPDWANRNPKESIYRVTNDSPLRVDISVLSDTMNSHTGELIKKITSTKGRSWEHEEEYRWLLRDDPSSPLAPKEKRLIDGKLRAFIPLPPSCISKVTLGYRSSTSLQKAIIEVRKLKGANWTISKAKLSLDSFEFDEEVINPLAG
jgi:hypothetical protein